MVISHTAVSLLFFSFNVNWKPQCKIYTSSTTCLLHLTICLLLHPPLWQLKTATFFDKKLTAQSYLYSYTTCSGFPFSFCFSPLSTGEILQIILSSNSTLKPNPIHSREQELLPYWRKQLWIPMTSTCLSYLTSPKQSAFKVANSAETALVAHTEKHCATRSVKRSSALLLHNLSVAFNTGNHKTLLPSW